MFDLLQLVPAWATPALSSALQHLHAPYALVELFSMSCALLGSLLLALKGKHAGWGWVLFALSNAGWIVFAQGYGHWFLLVQQIGFSITSLIGIWQYLFSPWIDRVFQRLINPVGGIK